MAQVAGQDVFLALLQEVDDHEGQDVRRQAPLLRLVHVTNLATQKREGEAGGVEGVGSKQTY